MTDPEFSRPIRIDTLGAGARTVAIEAEAAERDALARRFGLLSLDLLVAEAEVTAGTLGRIEAKGTIDAAVVQACVVTGQPLPSSFTAAFTLVFVPAAELAGEEVELEAQDLDTIGYEGGTIDLGEAAAETLVLELDPFPRAPDADEALRAAGVVGEEDAGPFGALKALKDRLV